MWHVFFQAKSEKNSETHGFNSVFTLINSIVIPGISVFFYLTLAVIF